MVTEIGKNCMLVPIWNKAAYKILKTVVFSKGGDLIYVFGLWDGIMYVVSSQFWSEVTRMSVDKKHLLTKDTGLCKDQHTSHLENLTMRHVRTNVAINHDHSYFTIDNMNQGFSLNSLEDMRFLHKYPMGQPTRQFPKQIEFGEGG